MRRAGKAALALAGTAAVLTALWLLYRDLDPARLRDALLAARPGWLALLAGAILAENWLRGWKWGQILHALKPVPALRLFGALMAGYAANLVAPFGVSPLVRSWLVARIEGIRFATVLVTAMIARFIDGLAFAALALTAAALTALPVPGLRPALTAGGLAHALVFGGLLWLLFRTRAGLGRDTGLASRLLDAVSRRGGARFAGLRLALAEGILWPRAALRRAGIIAASLAVKLLAALQILAAGMAVGLALGLEGGMLVTVTGGIGLILGRLVRIPGGFTIGAGLALHLAGVPEALALALILIRNTLTIGLNLLCGLAFLAWAGLDIRRAPRRTPHGPG